MISSLYIRNYAIIDELRLEFSKGLTIITGETGAGKSILLGALGLIMGERADRKLFYRKEKKCIIEGVFQVGAYDLKDFFDAHELDYDEEVIVRREITPSGKSRAFVNDTPVNLDILRKLTGALIDLHRQFDTQDINDVSFQLRMVDALAGNKKKVKEYGILYKEYTAKRRELAQLKLQSEAAAKELDFLRFQIEELEQAALSSGEDENLEQQLKRMENAENIQENLFRAVQAIQTGDLAALNLLRSAGTDLSAIAPFDERVAHQAKILDGLILDLEAVADELQIIQQDIQVEPEKTAQIRARLDLIYRLQKKHQALNAQALLDTLDTLKTQAASFENIEDSIRALETAVKDLRTRLIKKAKELSANRRKVTEKFEQTVTEGLHRLSMPNARLKIDIRPLEAPGPTGMDEVRFLFSANKGGELLPVEGIASGGELSRLALVTKSLVAGAIPLPTIIFDEIDAGVSGDVARRMGEILEKLTDKHQVVAITHSPQVAAKAHAHYFIYKTDEADHTVTKVKLLSEEERIRHIAVMLSQNPPSEAALLNAKELIGS